MSTIQGPVGEAEILTQTFRHLRATEFPWTAESTYLNNASIGPIPERTRRVVDAFTAKRTAPYLLPDRDLQEVLRNARAAVARLINADVDEIALATNTSHGLNLAARALPIRPGDTILLSDKEFPANVYPWLLLRDRGVHVDLVPTTPKGWPDEGYLLERLEDPRVRVLAVSWVQFSNGYRVDLGRLGEACRSHGAFLVVDGIQGIGQMPFDVKQTPVDILACGGQKWLMSPWGSGFVYVRRALMEFLEPVVPGWMAFRETDDFSRLTDYNPTFHADGRRFETVTLPFQDFAGMTESIQMIQELGVSCIASYLQLITEPVVHAAERGAFKLASPSGDGKQSAIVCATPPSLAETYHQLKRANVVCSMREGTIRFSPHCYNTVEEMERVAAILCGE
jgi:cysteine desulfurase / selenocysteine lyase